MEHRESLLKVSHYEKEIEKRIELYKDEIRKLYETIKRNEIQTEKDVNELHNIFGDPF